MEQRVAGRGVAARVAPASVGYGWTSARRAHDALGALVVAILGLAYFNPLVRGYTFSNVGAYETVLYPWAGVVPSLKRAFFPQSDYPEGGYPSLQLMHTALRAGHIPTWSAGNFGGVPVLGGFFYGSVFYPVRLVVTYLLTAAWSHDVYVTFHVVVAGLAFYALARRVGASVPAAVIGGVSWMLAPAWFAFSPFEAPAVLGAWLPIVLLAGDALACRPTTRRIAAFGLVAGVAILALHVQYGIYTVATGALWALLAAEAAPWRRASLRPLGARLLAVVSGCAIAFAVAAPLLLVTAHLLAESNRTALPEAYVLDTASMGLDRWLEFAHTDLPSPPTPADIWTCSFLGLGGAILFLAGFPLARGRAPRASRILVVLGVLVLSGTPLTSVAYRLLPGFSSIDPLGRLLPMVVAPALLLAALAFDDLIRRLGSLGAVQRRNHRTLALIALVLGAAVTASQYWQLATLDRAMTPAFEPRDPLYRFPETPAIRAIHDAAPTGGGRQQRTAMIPTSTGIVMLADEPNLFGIDHIGGYENVVPKRTMALVRFAQGEAAAAAQSKATGSFRGGMLAESARWTLLPRLGVTTLFTPPQYAANASLVAGLRSIDARVSYAGPDGAVFRVGRPMPRAFVVGAVETLRGSAALDRLASAGFDPARSVILEESPPARAGRAVPRSSVSIAPVDGNRRRFAVTADARGYLVMLDAYGSGWHARVNGAATPVRPADVAFRAVQVPAGRSIVTLSYEPPGLRSGLVIALFGLAGATLLLIGRPSWARRARPRRAPR